MKIIHQILDNVYLVKHLKTITNQKNIVAWKDSIGTVISVNVKQWALKTTNLIALR